MATPASRSSFPITGLQRKLKWLQHHIFGLKTAFLHGPVDIPDGVFIAGDDVKIGAHFHATIPDRVGNILEIIYGKFLWDHIDDLVSGRDICFVLIGYQLDLTSRCVISSSVCWRTISPRVCRLFI